MALHLSQLHVPGRWQGSQFMDLLFLGNFVLVDCGCFVLLSQSLISHVEMALSAARVLFLLLQPCCKQCEP